MAISKQQIILEIDADTGEVLKATSDLQKNMEGVAEAANEAAEATNDIGKAGSKAGGALKQGAGAGVSGFKALKTAIAATGLIGLAVKVLGPILEAFLENKKVADAFGVALSAVGVIVNDIVGFAVNLGEKLVETFKNPKQALLDLKDLIVTNITNRITGLIELLPALAKAFSLAFELKFAEAGKVATDAVAKVALGVDGFTDKLSEATDAVVDYAKSTATAVSAATSLEKELQRVSDAERDLAVRTAQSRAEVEELKRQRDDERLSIEERAAAAERAAAIDQAIADENVRLAEQKADLLRREIELQGETEERLQAVADAEIAAADARGASAAVQTELQTSLFALNAEAEAQRQEQEDAEIERQQAELERRKELAEALATEKELELMKLREDYEAKLALAREFGEGEEQLTEEFEAKKAEIEEKYAEEKVEREKVTAQEVVDAFQNAYNAIQALQAAFGTQNEKQARRNFKIQKALSLAQTTIGTVEGVQNAFTTAQKSPITALFPGYPLVQAGIAAAFGAAQLATIAKSKYQGGTSAPPPPPSGGGGGGAPAGGGGAQPPQLDLSFLGEGAGQEGPIQAYVVSENVSNAQQANQKIQEQASL